VNDDENMLRRNLSPSNLDKIFPFSSIFVAQRTTESVIIRVSGVHVSKTEDLGVEFVNPDIFHERIIFIF
jgi:hypothetical protein